MEIATGQGHQIQHVAISVNAGTTALVSAPTTGQRIHVYNYVVVSTTAGTVKFTDGTADLTGAMSCAATGGISAPGGPSEVWFSTAPTRPLNIVTSAAAAGHLSYYIAP